MWGMLDDSGQEPEDRFGEFDETFHKGEHAPLWGLFRPDEDLSWQHKALCSQTDPEVFFPEKGGSTRDAKLVCAQCEVRELCLQWAIDHDERFGIWGGLSERERRKYKKEHREQA